VTAGLDVLARTPDADEEEAMKYVHLIYTNPVIQSEMSANWDILQVDIDRTIQELMESGEWVGAGVLADPVTGKVVGVEGGTPAVTDGPYLETKEHLAGYCVVECESMERAIEIAARWPAARYHAVEVRPLMNHSGCEM
jgi:hypothetical protein